MKEKPCQKGKAKKVYSLTPKTHEVMERAGLWTKEEEEHALDDFEGIKKCDFCEKKSHFNTTIILDSLGWKQEINVCHKCRDRPIHDLFLYAIDLSMVEFRKNEQYSGKMKKERYHARIPASNKSKRFRKVIKGKKRSKSVGPIPKVPDTPLPSGVW